ncbi:MAG: squalene synthase HpnC [Blastochloris sp.]|nr:squalene synthase HpnC [Blastochloris sp.]
MSPEESYQRCTELARSHYENFPVGKLVPASLQPHVHAVYAFSRVADDLADEGYADPRLRPEEAPAALSQDERLQKLRDYRDTLDRSLREGRAEGEYAWIFCALLDTIQKLDLPPQLFHDLLSAFEQDIVKRRYDDFAQVLDYCTRSANPIGRLVLLLHGYRDTELHLLSDHICTGLQLANFWQDVSVDLGKDRIYLPLEDLERFKVSEKSLFAGQTNQDFRDLLRFQTERTWDFFHRGKSLSRHLSTKLAWEIRMTWLGGTTILKKIEAQNYDTLSRRPKLSKWDMLFLLVRSFVTS